MRFSLNTFKKVLERRLIPEGSVIFHEGDQARGAFIVLRGAVQIWTKNKQGKDVLLTEVKEGEMFGELALMTPDSTRSATANSADGCELLVVSQEKLRERLDAADPIIRYWIKYLSDRVVDLSKRTAG
jgi:CRP-like cAMP-binding protein